MRIPNTKAILAGALISVFVGMVVFLGTGCATTEENTDLSPRPWNSPKGWETGIPPALYERQR